MEFCKETNFKETPIGKIPKDWELKKLGDVAKIRRGASPRPKGDPRYFGGGIPWIKISDLAKYQKGLYLVRTDDTVTEEGKRKSVYLEDGALIISNSGTIGRPAIIKTGIGGCIHDGFITVDPIKGGDKYYLFYFFDYRKDEFQLRAQKGTQGNMNTNIWRSIKLPLPPVQEQLSIVEVLSIVDLAIQKTDEIIAKTERLKKGLMQTLLTRGIGHKEYKQTPIGTTPKEWQVVKLSDVADVVSGFGFPLDYQGKTQGKYPFIKVGDMNYFEKYVTSAENFVDDEDVECLKAKVYPPSTIIFPKIGMAIYLNKFRILKVWGTFDNNVAGVIPKKIESEFLFYYFAGKVNLKQLSSRTTAPSIRKSTLESLLIPFPPQSEQEKIAEALSTIDRKLAVEKMERSRLERIKKGLMDLLLTGKIRVKVD